MTSPEDAAAAWVQCGLYSYNPKDLLGKGSFAEVFRGVRKRDGADVAVKCIHKSRLRKSSNQRLLDSEISIMQGIKHKHIVELLDCVRVDPYICLVMEFCDKGDLGTYISEQAPLPEEQIAVIVRQLADALQYLRSKDIVHRDLKPQNILLSSDTELQPCLKIADFGFARQLVDEDMAATFCGSPLYMAPEVLEGDSYNAKADLWSLGTIVYQTLTGQVPFKAPSMKALKHLLRKTGAKASYPMDASAEIVHLLQQLLQPDPVQRLDFDELLAHPFVTGRALSPHLSPRAQQRSESKRPMYGDTPRSPSPSDSTLFASSDSGVVHVPLPSQAARGQDGQTSISVNSFVEVDKPSVELTILAEAIRDGRARLVKPGTFHPSEIASFVALVQNVSKPAAAIMAVAQARISSQREGAVMRGGVSNSDAESGLNAEGEPESPCNTKEQAEALVLLQRALSIFRPGMAQLQTALEQKRGIAFTLEGSRELQFLSKKFNDCLAKIERVKHAIRGCRQLMIASAEELMYEEAIRLCREAAGDEALHNIETSEVLYSRALTLLEQLLVSCTEPEDARVLERYARATQRRLQIVAEQSQARAAAVAAAQHPEQQHNSQQQQQSQRSSPPQSGSGMVLRGGSAMQPTDATPAWPPAQHSPPQQHPQTLPQTQPQHYQQQQQTGQPYPQQAVPAPHHPATTPSVPIPGAGYNGGGQMPHDPYQQQPQQPYQQQPQQPYLQHSGYQQQQHPQQMHPQQQQHQLPSSFPQHQAHAPMLPNQPRSFDSGSVPSVSGSYQGTPPTTGRPRTSSAASRVFCVSCGTPFGDSHRYCPNCGSPRPMPVPAPAHATSPPSSHPDSGLFTQMPIATPPEGSWPTGGDPSQGSWHRSGVGSQPTSGHTSLSSAHASQTRGFEPAAHNPQWQQQQ